MIRRRTRRTACAFVGCLLATAAAADGFYLAGDAGLQLAPSQLLRGGDDDRASRCDEFVNPQFAALAGCTNSARGDGAVDAWMSVFDDVRGPLAGAALGYRVGDRVRVELALSARNAAYEQSSPILDLDGIAFTSKFGSELPQASERIESVRSVDAFVNAYFVMPKVGRLTPYVGVGVGLGTVQLEYAALWRRSDDPNTVESARGLPNEQEVRRNLAGTVSRAGGTLRDTLRGYQLLAGVEHELNHRLTLALQGRWVALRPFAASGSYDELRSHTSNLRRDGSEPVIYRVSTKDTGFASVGLRLVYRFSPNE